MKTVLAFCSIATISVLASSAPRNQGGPSQWVPWNRPASHHGNPLPHNPEGPWHWQPRHGGGHGARPHPHGPGGCKQIQHRFPRGTNSRGQNKDRADAVKAAYVAAWNEYTRYALGNDTLLPVTKQGQDDFYAWSLTAVDGIDTAIMMGLTDIVDQQLAIIAATDYSYSPQLVDGFDTIIRYIAGLLSAYDLITSELVPNADHYNKDHVQACLDGAQTLADLLMPQFNTPSGLPYFFINTTTHVPTNNGMPTNTAICGTIILEYHRLSDLTGDEKYRQVADRAESHLVNPVPTPLYPALVGSQLNQQTGEFTSFDIGWQSGIDSFYEYLIKSYIYDPTASTAQDYLDFWIQAVESTEKHLASHPDGFPELTFITQLDNSGSPLFKMDDYACFAGGNFLLGGSYLGRQDMLDLGVAVTDSCHKTFNTTASGLNPLTFAWYGPNKTLGDPTQNTTANLQYFEENGYFVTFGLYTLFPEPIESIMYAYRITGDEIWQEYNWEIFQAMQRDGNRDGVVMSSLTDITKPLGGDFFNYLPSYYFAETLKYLYMSFSDTDLVSLDDFTFNTESHPFRIQGGTCSTTKGGRGHH